VRLTVPSVPTYFVFCVPPKPIRILLHNPIRKRIRHLQDVVIHRVIRLHIFLPVLPSRASPHPSSSTGVSSSCRAAWPAASSGWPSSEVRDLVRVLLSNEYPRLNAGIIRRLGRLHDLARDLDVLLQQARQLCRHWICRNYVPTATSDVLLVLHQPPVSPPPRRACYPPPHDVVARPHRVISPQLPHVLVKLARRIRPHHHLSSGALCPGGVVGPSPAEAASWESRRNAAERTADAANDRVCMRTSKLSGAPAKAVFPYVMWPTGFGPRHEP